MPVCDQRWLTVEEKAMELSRWALLRESVSASPRFPEDGFPDPAIFPLVDALNRLPGICTIQSCAGHFYPGFFDQRIVSGHLWLRLDQRMSDAHARCIHRLAAHSLMERVGFFCAPDGRLIAELVFAGEGRQSLTESAAVIIEHFTSLAPESGS